MDNYINMVKFSSKKNSEFQRVAGHLKLIANKAPRKVEQNWLIEGSVQASKRDRNNPFMSDSCVAVFVCEFHSKRPIL
jgi:hypothetical protein